jgi:branched-chain amino acid transport system substrate-binding protein
MSWSVIGVVIPLLYTAFGLIPSHVNLDIDSSYNVYKSDTITLGLLVNNLQEAQQTIHAAQMAINQENINVGQNGIFIKLAVKATDGPWGQASTKTAELIYEDDVVAIIGSLDGRTAHLTEQVTAKSQIPYIETHATDPTLSKAFVPWFFRVVPNDYQASRALAKDIYERRKFSRVAVISDNSYDGKMASTTFEKVIAEKKLNTPTYFVLDDQNPDFPKTVLQLRSGEFQAVVVITKAAIQNHTLMTFFQESTAQIYHMREQLTVSSYPAYTVPVVANPAKYEKFNMQLQKLTNAKPSAPSIYVFDAVNLLLRTMSSIRYNPELIGKHIGKMDAYDGISGQIKFDEHGDLTRSVKFPKKSSPD